MPSMDLLNTTAKQFTIYIIASDACFVLLNACIAYICEFCFQTKHRVLSTMFLWMTIGWIFNVGKAVMLYEYFANFSASWRAQCLGYIARSFMMYSALWYLFFWIKILYKFFDQPKGNVLHSRDREELKWRITWGFLNFGICAVFIFFTIWTRHDRWAFIQVTSVYHVYWGAFVFIACFVGIWYGRRILAKFQALEQQGERFDVDVKRARAMIILVGVYAAITMAFEIWFAVSQLSDSAGGTVSLRARIFAVPCTDTLLQVIFMKFFGWQPLRQFFVDRFWQQTGSEESEGTDIAGVSINMSHPSFDGS